MRPAFGRGLSVALALVMIGSVFAIAAGPAGASGVPTVELTDPGDETDSPASVDLVLGDVDDHEVGAFQVDVTFNDENVSLSVSEPDHDRFTIQSEQDGGTMTIVGYTGEYGVSDDLTLAEITASGSEGDIGEVEIDEVTTLADTDGDDVTHIVGDPVSFTFASDSDDDDSGGGGGGGGGGFAPEPDLSVPSAAISIDPDPASIGEDVTFSGAESTDEERDINSYEWEIDGETFNGETVTKAFDAAGTYDVELTVTNTVGMSDTATATVTVEQDDAPSDDDDDITIEEPGDPDDDADDDGIPGFGATVALVAFLSAALLALRRQN